MAQARPIHDHDLRLERHYAASRERVFRAWTNVAELKKWWGPRGFTTELAELDVRPGGHYRLGMRSPDGDLYVLGGTYRVVEPPQRLVFTFVWEEGEHAGVETLVTVDFHEEPGGTRLVVTHELFTDAEWADSHRGGWTSQLDRFVDYLREA
jgi:uncharacterized protein YndB with AHSA1/START domain